MPADFEGLYQALRERMTAVWPEAQPNGFYEAEHVAQIAWEKLAAALPFGVLALSNLDDGDWGLTNLTWEAPVDLYYVCRVDGPSSNLRPKLMLIADNLWRSRALTVTVPAPAEVSQVIRVSRPTWDDTLLPNRIFLAKEMPVRAGRITARCIVGETK